MKNERTQGRLLDEWLSNYKRLGRLRTPRLPGEIRPAFAARSSIAKFFARRS